MKVIFQNFIAYFGRDDGFIDCLLVYFPFYVVIFSVIVNFFTHKIIIAPIIVLLVFGSFFAYTYSQFNATLNNFTIPLIGYVIISYVVGFVVNKIKRRFIKN